MQQGYVVKIQKTQETAELSNKQARDQVVAKDDASERNSSRQAIATALIQSGKQALNAGFNSYIQMSGNNSLARSVSAVIGISGDIATMAAGGWVGVAAVATKTILTTGQSTIETTLANRQIEFNNQELGYISRQGSRYWG